MKRIYEQEFRKIEKKLFPPKLDKREPGAWQRVAAGELRFLQIYDDQVPDHKELQKSL
jgi:hypothetical protein